MSELNPPHALSQITVTLMGQNYQVPCAEDEQGLLLEAVQILNKQLDVARSRSKLVSKERDILMVAVNLAADLQRLKQELQMRQHDLQQVEQRLQHLVDRAKGSE